MSEPKKLDRIELAKLISEMTFKPIDPDLPLNHVYDIGGDEAQSVFERICAIYSVDVDKFWSKVDFHRFFFMELNPYSILVTIWKRIKSVSGQKIDDDERDPFTIDMLLEILESCRSR